MRIPFSLLALLIALTMFSSGCAGPEKKFGRGLNNVTEFARLGEMRRSIEQTALWDHDRNAFTTGFIRGLNRSMVRTVVGAYELVTAPIPPYDALFTSKYRIYPDATIKNKRYPWGGFTLAENPVYPDSYRPNLIADSIFSNDTNLGFSGGDVAPFIPGSRFHIFDN
ncbi:MAG TPA: exosortase system-associated protein, TIGR04073 family [Candidatus Eisenbacteria bacterium]|jgi:putative exosortase-associated protein (TIGR04073 family)|nr:exosortase system-associated protein, TIGR04073 family [Candidatus Eisenbacteria bacterium]